MIESKNWDDARFVLAVAREGTLSAAARSLGVTHATVMRRIASFEADHGRPVFLKSASGYSVLPEAEPILRSTQNVEDAIFSIERAVQGTDQSLSGKVRIASTDSFCIELLPDIVRGISATYPELSLGLLSANTLHDLARLTADIAIRPTPHLEDGLVGEKVGELEFGLYASGTDCVNWIGMKGPLARSKAAQWVRDNIAESEVCHETDSFMVMRELAALGWGMAFLPKFLGRKDSSLEEIEGRTPGLNVPVWVAVQEELAENVRFRIVRRALCLELRKVFDPQDLS